MALQRLLWTTLPNGLTDDGLRVSVFLSPRLSTDPEPERQTLASFFPDWEDWPATLRRATFRVSYGGAVVEVPATQTDGPSHVDEKTVDGMDSAVWKALFHGGLFVRGYEFKDLSGTPVSSFDTVAVAGLVQDLYRELARTANGDLPRVSDIVDDPDWKALIEAVAAFDEYVDEKTGLRRPEALLDLTIGDWFGRFQELARLQVFHLPPQKPQPVVDRPRGDDDRIKASWMEQERTPLPAKAELAKQLDFHQIVAAMGSYPTLLRRLGLVVDLVLDRASFSRAPDGRLFTTVEFPPDALRVPAEHASPRTRAGYSRTAFTAVSNPTLKAVGHEFQVVDGLLDLDPARFAFLQADVDGAGLKLLGFARSLRRLMPDEERVDPTTRFEKELGAPALRTAGLMLVHSGRGESLVELRGEQGEERLRRASLREEGRPARPLGRGPRARVPLRRLGPHDGALALALPPHGDLLPGGRHPGGRAEDGRGGGDGTARRHRRPRPAQAEEAGPRLPPRGGGLVDRLEPDGAAAGARDLARRPR